MKIPSLLLASDKPKKKSLWLHLCLSSLLQSSNLSKTLMSSLYICFGLVAHICHAVRHIMHLAMQSPFFFFFTLDDMTDFPSPLVWDLGFFPVH